MGEESFDEIRHAILRWPTIPLDSLHSRESPDDGAAAFFFALEISTGYSTLRGRDEILFAYMFSSFSAFIMNSRLS